MHCRRSAVPTRSSVVLEVGYDNERGKGDHRHFRDARTAYTFTTIEQLMADFWQQMSDVKITVGGAIEDEASQRFVDAWHRAERGEIFHERHLAFESWDAFARVLTGKRM
jgi:hypothetical protein